MSEEKQIYILLSDTGTVLSKMIRWATRYPLSHASIAFDPELREIYSFGRKDPHNPFIGGFVKERVYGSLIRESERVTMCALYRCAVSKSTYERVREQIRRIEENQHRYKYNVLGLFGILFNVKIERENAYFCSQFVASVLQDNGVRLVPKIPAFITPADFATSSKLQLVFRGDLRDYMSGLWRGRTDRLASQNRVCYMLLPRKMKRSYLEFEDEGTEVIS